MVIDFNVIGSVSVCARFYTQLPIVYICSSLKSTTYSYSFNHDQEKKQKKKATRVLCTPFNLIWTFWRVRNKRSKIAAGTSYIRVFVHRYSRLNFFKYISARQRNERERETSIGIASMLIRNSQFYSSPRTLRYWLIQLFFFYHVNLWSDRDNNNLHVGGDGDDDDWLLESTCRITQRKGDRFEIKFFVSFDRHRPFLCTNFLFSSLN